MDLNVNVHTLFQHHEQNKNMSTLVRKNIQCYELQNHHTAGQEHPPCSGTYPWGLQQYCYQDQLLVCSSVPLHEVGGLKLQGHKHTGQHLYDPSNQCSLCAKLHFEIVVVDHQDYLFFYVGQDQYLYLE